MMQRLSLINNPNAYADFYLLLLQTYMLQMVGHEEFRYIKVVLIHYAVQLCCRILYP